MAEQRLIMHRGSCTRPKEQTLGERERERERDQCRLNKSVPVYFLKETPTTTNDIT